MTTKPVKIRRVSVLIVSWNGREHLEICLPAVLSQETPGFEVEVLVLDNASSDGTAEWLGANHPEVELVASPVNLGFCAGNNRLVERAQGDAVVLLNNDTRPRPGWLAALVDALASAPDDVAAVSGQIVDWDGERLDFARGVMTFDGHAFQQDTGRKLTQVEQPAHGAELLFACGGNMIVRRSTFLDLGGFDESYFAYLEDVDLGWRVWSAGLRVLYAPDAVVHHRSMATSQRLGNHNRGFLFERNAFLTVYKNYQAGLWERMMPAVQLTLEHRTQALLVQNNPGAETLTVNPYDGLLADTGAGDAAADGVFVGQPPPSPTLLEKWRGYGPRDFFKRGVRKALRSLTPWVFETPEAPTGPEPRVTDGRTIAQLRAISNLLTHLDRAAESRRATQARRRRDDLEIFERFPLHIVPTYPGDERLFGTTAFASWLPDDVPCVRRSLSDVMHWDP